jgi:hypothetical protein
VSHKKIQKTKKQKQKTKTNKTPFKERRKAQWSPERTPTMPASWDNRLLSSNHVGQKEEKNKKEKKGQPEQTTSSFQKTTRDPRQALFCLFKQLN